MQSFRSLTHVDSLDLPDGARVSKVPKSVSAIGIVGLIVFGIFCIPTLLFPALEPNKNTRPLVIVRVTIFAGFRSSSTSLKCANGSIFDSQTYLRKRTMSYMV